ncbi:hypothetical protein AKUH4B406M_01500 [Apilactobacillus kunkeei]|nr:hypothetical protein AKUH4B406M_01500 [Apilactobacillus kunkeei]
MSLENTKDKVVGKATELKGKATGSKLDELKGKAQNFFGKAKDSFR